MKTKTFIAITLLLIASGCSSPPGTWGWYVIDPSTQNGWNNIKFLLSGFSATIRLSILAAFLSIIIGLVVALPGMSLN